MEVQGKIIQKLPLQEGTSKAGNAWRKQVYILETLENYPKKVAFDFFGDRINQYDSICEVGATITLSYDIESREFNGRWYTDIRGWKAERYDPSAAPAPGAPAAGQQPYAQQPYPQQPYAQAPMAQMPTSQAPVPPAPAAGPAPIPPAPDFAQEGSEDNLPF